MTLEEGYFELCHYTLTHGDRQRFVHQHLVDAHTAQTADAGTKPIAVVYALAGLYLTVEKNYTGLQVQQAHQTLSKNKTNLPRIALPDKRGDITVLTVLDIPPGPERDEMIRRWCASVWGAYAHAGDTIRRYCDENLR